ncbi:citrate lyase acyl carrier protein [bacterium]|nr:citrate lyase acyl carrier protein [bacterium]
MKRKSKAGRLSKGDIFVEIAPSKKGDGIKLDIQSSQKKLYGKAIEKTIKGIIREFDIKDALISVTDDGALDFVVRARTEAAILEAMGVNQK